MSENWAAGGRKTILMVDYAFPPVGGAGAQRTLGYVAHLSKFGWSPIVLTVASGHASYYDPSLLDEIPDGVFVVRARSIEPARFVRHLLHRSRHGTGHSPSQTYRPVLSSPSGWMRTIGRWITFPDRRIGWLPFAVARSLGLRLGRRVDVIYSSSTAVTSHLIALILKMLWSKLWVADFQDPWSQFPLAPLPSRLHKFLADRLEHRILREADHVIVTTHPIREMFLEKYPDISASKLTVIPMGFEPGRFRPEAPVSDGRFTITHLGSFYGTRSAAPFLQGLGRCVKQHPDCRSRVQVWFFGHFDAKTLAEAERAIKEYELEQVVRLGDPVAHEEGLRSAINSDVVLLVEDDGLFGRWRLQTKLFEYLGARRPILALVPEGPAARLLRETGGAVVVAPSDVRGISEAIWELFLSWRSGSLTFSGNEDMVRSFSWEERTKELVSTIERVWKESSLRS